MQRLRRKMAAKQASSAATVTADGLTVKIASYQSAAGSHVTHFPVISTLALGDPLAEPESVPPRSKEVNGGVDTASRFLSVGGGWCFECYPPVLSVVALFSFTVLTSRDGGLSLE